MRLARPIRISLLVAAVALLTGGCASGGPVRQGQAAPALAVTTLAGTPDEVRPAHGQALWLNFWASWCRPCRAEWPQLNQAQRDLAGQGLTLIAISVNERAGAVEQFLEEHPAGFAVVLDPSGEAAARYGVIGFPTQVLIGRDGVVQAIVRGPLDEARARELLDLTGAPYSGKQNS
jgi:thiol-disulfide isomerase/thioredoxin